MWRECRARIEASNGADQYCEPTRKGVLSDSRGNLWFNNSLDIKTPQLTTCFNEKVKELCFPSGITDAR